MAKKEVTLSSFEEIPPVEEPKAEEAEEAKPQKTTVKRVTVKDKETGEVSEVKAEKPKTLEERITALEGRVDRIEPKLDRASQALAIFIKEEQKRAKAQNEINLVHTRAIRGLSTQVEATRLTADRARYGGLFGWLYRTIDEWRAERERTAAIDATLASSDAERKAQAADDDAAAAEA